MTRFVRHEMILFAAIVLALVVLSSQSSQFLTVQNLLNQGRLMTEIGLIAVVMTFVIVTGGIDLSVGSIVGLVAIMLGVLWKNAGLPLPLAMAAAVAVGTFAGFANGWVIVRYKLPPLVATLATLALYRGLAQGISESRSVRGYPDWFYWLGQGSILAIPVQLWVLVVVAVVAGGLLAFTRWGRTVYAIGANETAARFSAMSVDHTKLVIYTASGLISAVAAIIFVSRVTTTRADMGSGYELDAITAVVLGGTSVFGGKGTVLGTMLGLVLIQLLKNGLSLAGVKGDGTVVLIGAVLILTVLVSNFVNRGGNR